MRDSYVNNLEEILAANDAQRGKIEFLERESLKRQSYLRDLQQNIRLNKQTLRILNMNGPNDSAITLLTKQNALLSQSQQWYYEQYQNINAMYLMETQLRLEDRSFYQQRLQQFENKISDLRKYLHDKEDSFSAVVIRLKKYEDLGDNSMQDKVGKQGKEAWETERIEVEGLKLVTKERNQLRQKIHYLEKQLNQLQLLKTAIKNTSNYQKVTQIIKEHTQHKVDSLQLPSLTHTKSSGDLPTENTSHLKTIKAKQPATKPSSSHRPNKQLVRLLKKQKLNNQILNEALTDAIQKNEELIAINQRLRQGLQQQSHKVQRLRAQNSILCGRLAEYDRHYARKALVMDDIHLKDTITGNNHIQGNLTAFLNNKLQQYSRLISNKYNSYSRSAHISAIQSYQHDLQKLMPFLSFAPTGEERMLMVKSASQPQLLKQYELDDNQPMLIEEY